MSIFAYPLVMGRILAIDYGKRRTGLAVTDPLRITPGVLATLDTKELLPYLEAYIPREGVDLVVVGYARQMDGSDSDSMRYIKPFTGRLQALFPHLSIVLHDERFTSKLAQQAILASGVSKKRRQEKGLVDRVSAVIILQSYLDSQIP